MADAPASSSHANTGAPRAPSSPPLSTGGGAARAGEGEEGARGSVAGEADPLVANGLASPLCRGSLGAGELTASARRNCETSGFVAAPAPTGSYGLDVHIDTGLLGISSGGLLSTVQDLFVAPLWMALVWAVHAMVVMLEWCFSIDLLDGPAGGGVGGGLRRMQASLTVPWLACVLAVASLLALYNGMIRRRVAETLGQAALMAAMMAGGLWLIADPSGTVGALGGWANGASLGTLAVAAGGAPAGPGRALSASMQAVFDAVIEAPWCYLEFGDVGWCRTPDRLDPRLRAAGLRIAASELAQIGCSGAAAAASSCAGQGSAQSQALLHSAALLRGAQTNGAIFLALAPNGPARNSINEQGSLLRTLCQSSEATHCQGPTAAQAQFRTAGQTWSRVGGLLLIAAGVLGMLLLLGFLALRLLEAAVFALLYLLLTPAVVLAPAFGESGRAVFRRWLAQLLGAVVSKLLFSFILGVVLGVLAILASLQTLGWWTQWLLMSAFWWGAYLRRHQALGVAEGALGRSPERSRRTIPRRLGSALEGPRRALVGARALRSRFSSGDGEEEARQRVREERGRRVGDERLPGAAAEGPERTPAAAGEEQVQRTLASEHREASALASRAPEIRGGLSARRTQLERIGRGRESAIRAGDGRRAALLDARRVRIEHAVEREQQALNAALRLAREETPASSVAGGRVRTEERERLLDAQAALPSSVQAHRERRGERRDYPALAALAGYGRAEYERLDPPARRAARLEIDRELAVRRELRRPLSRTWEGDADARAPRREQGSPTTPRAARGGDAPEESPVMRDAREVAARRKRQLGFDRP